MTKNFFCVLLIYVVFIITELLMEWKVFGRDNRLRKFHIREVDLFVNIITKT